MPMHVMMNNNGVFGSISIIYLDHSINDFLSLYERYGGAEDSVKLFCHLGTND